MSAPSLLALLLTLTGAFAYINQKLFKLPISVGLMGLSMGVSVICMVGESLGLPLQGWAASTVAHVNFSEALLDGMLSFLLFAGALQVDLDELREQRMTVALLATVGVLISTALVGLGSWVIFHWLGLAVPLMGCLTFGALISPTDPIAVMAMLKQMNASKSLSTKIAGESLFNDGVGIVVFVMIFRMWASGTNVIPPWQQTGLLLLREVGGGLVIGLLLGAACFLLLRSVDNYQVEMLLTLAMVSGGYQLARLLHASGALAIVVAGLVIGSYGRRLAMSELTRYHLDVFWETLDEILNGILFVLIGLEVLVLELKPGYVVAGLCLVPIILLVRWISLALPIAAIESLRKDTTPVLVMTWGGLRGGISIALALSLPAGHVREVLLVATYTTVAFSILLQAPTMPWLLKTALGHSVEPSKVAA